MNDIARHILLRIGGVRYRKRLSRVIYYHDIHSGHKFTSMSTHVDLFRRHLEILSDEEYAIVGEITQPLREVEITFDDGFRGLYENFQIFVENAIHVRVFLVTEMIGKRGYMTQKELDELLSTGLLHIGSHTLSHKSLHTISSAEAWREICESKKRLEDMFGTCIDAFCYPKGEFTPFIVETAKACGYKKQYSCLPGSFFNPHIQCVINRSLVQHVSEKSFRLILKGADEVFLARYLRKHYFT